MPMLPLLLALCLVPTVRQDADPSPALELLDHAGLTRELKAIVEAYPDLARIERVALSRGGRSVDALRLGGPPGADERARPAILLVANLEGARVYASAVALQHARALAERHAGDDEVRALLDTTTIWIVPRANPDAAEARFASPRSEQHASGPGVDDDRDGRQGEDPRSDVDGDGVITWIRVADPDGKWMPDPADDRALVEAERAKGQQGVFALWPEGRDLDGDEKIAEDGPFAARVERNFPAGWQQHSPAAGVFPTDEPEVRGLCDFVIAHPQLALVVVYDGQDSLVATIKGVKDDAPRVKRIPKEGVMESDAKLLNELGKRYREATENEVESSAGDEGTFSRWCYEQRGLLTLSAVLWDISLDKPKKDEKDEKDEKDGEGEEGTEDEEDEEDKGEEASDEGEGDEGASSGEDPAPAAKGGKEKEPEPSDDAKRLDWVDAGGEEESWRFVPWASFEHPELGAVEIGGLAPYARLEPPAAESGAIAEAHLTWFLSLGALLPRVTIAECTREELGEGLHRVRAVIQNDSYLPLLSRSGRRTATTRPALVRLLLPEAGERLAGKVRELVSDLPGSGGRHEVTWLVHGPQEMEIAVSVETTHAGAGTRQAQEEE